MSSVVSGIGRAVGSVVSGAVSAVKKVASGVGGFISQIASSKLGKAAMLAAAIYFGGAAISGGMNAGAGTTFLDGMGTGVSEAANGLSSAWTSAMKGDFSGAGDALSKGFSGGTSPAGGAISTPVGSGNAVGNQLPVQGAAADMGGAGGVKMPASTLGQSSLSSGTGSLLTGSSVPPVPPPAAAPSMWGSQYTAPALISGGSAIIGGAMQGKTLENQRDYEAQQAQLARDRYNANAGGKVFATPAPTGGVPTAGAPASAGQYDPMAAVRAAQQNNLQAYQGYRPPGLVNSNLPYTA